MSQLENLPIEVLQSICRYVDDVSALALVSKRCLSAASVVLCSSLTIRFSTTSALYADVDQWISRLTRLGFQHTRFVELKKAFIEPPAASEPLDPGHEDLYAKWQYLEDVDHVREGDEHDRAWEPVANLIGRLPGLLEVHYSCAPQLAPCVLRSIESKGNCRLYLKGFHLRSLNQPRSQSISVTPHEVELASASCLYSITSIRFDRYDNGRFNFLEEAALSMASGTAPNLKEVSLCYQPASASLDYPGATRTESTVWKGTEFGGQSSDNFKGALSTLELSGREFTRIEALKRWAEATDFSQLKALKLRDYIAVPQLRWLTQDANLVALRSLTVMLELPRDDTEAEETEECFLALVRKLPPLHTLQISGGCRAHTLTRLLHIHGKSLQRLDAVSQSRLASGRFGIIDSASEEWLCPKLRQLTVPICRTNGDAAEIRQYRWIGKSFPNVQRLFLLMDCSNIGPGVNLEDQDPGEESILHYRYNRKVYSLRYVLQNHAIDRNLAEAIFRCISASKPSDSPRLERLELRCIKVGVSEIFPGDLWKICKGLSRHWVCVPEPRDDRCNSIRTTEVFPHSERDYYYSDEEEEDRYADIDEDVMEIFYSVWPKQHDRNWRDSWYSTPLEENVEDFRG